METRTSRVHSSSSSLSRSRSPISNSEKRSVSTSPRRGPSTPVKSLIERNDNNNEQDPNDRELLSFDDDSKVIVDERSSPIMSDIDQSHQKKRSRHRHHHHHHHRKHSKSNKRSATQHHRHSVKRSKKETVSTVHRNKSNDENVISSPEKNTSESQPSQSEQEISSSNDESNDEEGIVEGDSTPNERHSRHHRKKHRSSSNNEKNSQSPQSSSFPIPKNNKGTQLIVNYLPASLRESDFYQLFARIAPIKLCKLITDRYTGQSYCYGFIEYHTKEDATKAIEKYNGYRVEHKKLKVSYAQPKSNNNYDLDNVQHMNLSSSSSIQKNPNIYITDLPDDFDEKMLERLFSKYGEIVQTKVLRDPRTRISRGVAFVLMTSTRYAERAVKALDGYVPSGSHTPISVKYADLKKTVAAAAGNNGNMSSSSRLSSSSSMTPTIGSYGYPPGLPPLSMIDPYYAAALHHHHRAAINMRDLSPSPPPPPPPPPLQSYYSSGSNRSSRMRGSSPNLPRSYSSSSSKHNSNILTTPSNLNTSSTLAAAYDLIAKGCQQAIDPNGFVIYAFGLPHDCDENDLEELFRRYGEVYRVYIVRNYTTGESKGYSFITMRYYDDACHAVDRLDGTTFQGRTIQIYVANTCLFDFRKIFVTGNNNSSTTLTNFNNIAATASTISQLLNGFEHDDSNSSASAGAIDDVSSIMRNPWDPFHCADWDMQQPSATCLARIKRDIWSVFKDPPPGMFIAPDPDNITKIHALIVGPFDTPYEGGFFYFLIRCPPDYPIRAPRCRLMTTGNNTVRFNPNLYRNGKVCLSILGTWSGPSWSPAQCISSLLISIQSLMSEKPYHNEPGFEHERTSGDSKTYNEIIKHETLRVAVCEMLENENSCPQQLREVMIKQFFDFYDYYVEVCTENSNKDGQQMMDPFGDRRGLFEYGSILQRLKKLKARFELLQSTNNNNACSSRSSSISKHQHIDARTREIMNDAAALDPNPTSNDPTNLDDIFDHEDDEPDSSMDDDDDDDDNNNHEQQLKDSESIPTIQNAEQSKEKSST
ncbi:unnamed protein product [Rotaria sordida]|uniref:Ubiquitin-conjugating enzyme E2 Z n=1 Tax=Rotaria sordida TaxID=392033 RepID=A0A813P9R1_9BILA|nr:unnamed protein product [Rotaria sordida]